MRYKVLIVTNMKVTVVWDVALCSVVEISLHFRGSYCLYHQGNDHRPVH